MAEEGDPGAGAAAEDSPHLQQLRAALHYTVGRMCDEVAAERHLPFERSTVATLTEATLAQVALLARDLELFAQHARRSVVGPEEVKLLVRRSPALSREVQSEARRLAAEAEVQKERRRAQRGRRAAARGAAAAAAASGVRTDPQPEGDGEVVQLDPAES